MIQGISLSLIYDPKRGYTYAILKKAGEYTPKEIPPPKVFCEKNLGGGIPVYAYPCLISLLLYATDGIAENGFYYIFFINLQTGSRIDNDTISSKTRS